MGKTNQTTTSLILIKSFKYKFVSTPNVYEIFVVLERTYNIFFLSNYNFGSKQ